MWRNDTLFETGQLRLIQRELTDLGSCLDRVSSPVGQWQYLETAATLALATGRFAEAARLAREGFELFSDMGHPVAFSALSAILSQSGLHIGMDRSGLTEAFGRIPAPRTIDAFRAVPAKHSPPQDIDGLLAWAAGSDDAGLHVVTLWESKAHADRWAAEQLFPAFQAAGLADIPADSEFTECEAGELFVR